MMDRRYRSLCALMIGLAVKDVRRKHSTAFMKKVGGLKDRAKAWAWMRGESKGRLSMTVCCDVVGIERETILKGLENGAGEVRFMPRKRHGVATRRVRRD